MRIVVVGCGRVGAELTVHLAADGHDVRVVDRDPRARRMLPGHLTDRFHDGSGFSRPVLEGAGIDGADAVAAVTSNDNANLVTARTARQVYRVPLVLGRINDPVRADLYRMLGIPTVAGVHWTARQFHRMLLHRHLEPEASFGSGETLLVRSALPEHLTGRPLLGLELEGEIRVVEVTRGGHSLLPTRHTPAEPGDQVTFAVAATALGRLRGFLGRELGT